MIEIDYKGYNIQNLCYYIDDELANFRSCIFFLSYIVTNVIHGKFPTRNPHRRLQNTISSAKHDLFVCLAQLNVCRYKLQYRRNTLR